MMTALMLAASVFEWFATTKIGRMVGLIAIVAAVLFFAYLKVKSMGRAEEREKIEKETDIFIADKEKIDADIADDSDADLADRVRPWVSKGRK